MDWSRYLEMDPHLLVGLVNTELRNHSSSLADLCRTHDVDMDKLTEHLASKDYIWQEAQGQFR